MTISQNAINIGVLTDEGRVTVSIMHGHAVDTLAVEGHSTASVTHCHKQLLIC